MKKLLSIYLLAFCAIPMGVNAQTPFNTMDSLDINKIHPAILVHGDMWWDPVTATAKCSFPNGGAKHVNFAGAVWMGGYDGSNNLHVAAQTYRQDGNDYWPGPLDSSDTLTYATSQQWAKIWKVNGTDVVYFNSLATHTIANTPASILTWPGKGNIYAQGNGGAVLNITDDMAPFVDLNGNGIYEPLLGEYPDFKGEQALWWVFSDNAFPHAQSHGRAVGAEIHAMAYAYSRGTLIDNVIYYDYTIINKSANNYHNFRFGIWDDIDLGYYMDDFIGFDSSRRLGICYNGTNDDGVCCGHPVNSYGLNPPMSGITLISIPGDAGTNYIPAGSFAFYNNDFSIVGSPSSDTVCYDYLNGKFWHSPRFSDDFQGPGVPDSAYVTDSFGVYAYPGDPTAITDSVTRWLCECSANDNPGDRRFILSTNDFTLNAGSSQHIVMAQVVTDTGNHGCPLATFTKIREVSDTAWADYYSPPQAFHKPVWSGGTLNINTYPNPAHDILYVEDRLHDLNGATITIYNYIGAVINVPVHQKGQRFELDVSHLPVGLYNVIYRNGSAETTTRFLKE